jgi:nitrite reductase (NADH) large subunit
MLPDEYIICVCAEVSKQQIINAMIEFKTNDISLICEKTGAGITCGGCRPVILDILKAYQSRTS